MKQTVLVLGANGLFGRATTEAFAAAGWRVLAQVRRAPAAGWPPGAEPVAIGAFDVPGLVASARGAAVVVNGLNPIYTRWEKDAIPLADTAQAVAERLGATLMLPGNVYNFGAGMPALLEETTSQRPTTSKGRIRVAIEQTMRDASARGLRSIVVRAGDFYGGRGRGSWLDLLIAKSLAGGVATWPGPLEVEHAWAYLPDLARACVQLAEQRHRLDAFEVVHFPGHAPTGRQFVAVLDDIAGRPLRLKSAPWLAMRLLSPVMPMFKALSEMRYLWQVPHRVSGERLQSIIGPLGATPFPQALAQALSELDLVDRPRGLVGAG